jgi:hypothetical protein
VLRCARLESTVEARTETARRPPRPLFGEEFFRELWIAEQDAAVLVNGEGAEPEAGLGVAEQEPVPLPVCGSAAKADPAVPSKTIALPLRDRSSRARRSDPGSAAG